MMDYRLEHVVPGQDPDEMYKWYEIYKPWPWPFNKIIARCGWILDPIAMRKNKVVQRQLKAIKDMDL